MADAAHVLHRLYERHGPAPTRSITHPIERPVAAAAPVLLPDQATDSSSDAPPESPPTSLPEPPPETPWTGLRSMQPARERRGGRFLLAALVVVLLIGSLGAYLLFGSTDDASPTSADTEVSDSSDTADRQPVESPSQEPVASESSAPLEQTPPTPPSSSLPSTTGSSVPSSPTVTGSAEQFASSYYAHLPDDTSAAWRSLAPSFRSSIGRESYDGFWSTISAVEVVGVDEVEPGVVDVSLTYTADDGTAESEVHRLYLEQAGTGYRIVDDAVVG